MINYNLIYEDLENIELTGLTINLRKKLKKIGINNLYSLIYYFPRTYETSAKIKKILELKHEENVVISGRIINITKRYLAYLVKLGLKKENIDISYDIYLKNEKKYEAFFNKIKENKKIILNPYGASKHKSFSIETLENIINYLKNKDTAIILTYFGDKYKELEFLEKKYKYVYIPKKIESILDTAILIKKSDYVISPDTSIVHIASAFNKKMITVYPPKGGKYGVDHLVWAPKSKYNKVIFCKDKTGNYDEIDINTFDFDEMKEEVLNLINSY